MNLILTYNIYMYDCTVERLLGLYLSPDITFCSL